MGDSTTSLPGSERSHAFQLAEFTIEPTEGTIAGPAGCVQVDPKVMAVLIVLSQKAGQVVLRQELLNNVWPGQVVGDDALSRCVYQLRRCFVEAGGSGSYRSLLTTLPKRGYRLNCKPSAQPASGSGTSKSVSFRLIGFGALVVSIALLGLRWWIPDQADSVALPTSSTEAYNVYLSANDYFDRSDRRIALPLAVDLYEDSVNLDPSFALALIGLTRAHTDMYWTGLDSSPDRLRRAESVLDRLFAYNPDLPEAHLARANFLLKGLNRFEDALAELEIAESSIPQDAEVHFLRSMAYRRLGYWNRAIDALDLAIELEPRNISHRRQQHINYLFLRRYDLAQDVLNDIVTLYPDDGTAYVDLVVLALCRNGDTALARQYDANSPSPFYDEGLAYTYTNWLAAIYDRDYGRALRIIDNSTEVPIFDGDLRNASVSPISLYYARTYALSGNQEEAYAWYLSASQLIEQQLGVNDEQSSRILMGWYLALSEAQAGMGLPEQALDSLAIATRLMSELGDEITSSALQIASVIRVLIPAGEHDQALTELDNYLSREAAYWSIEGLRHDPRLEPLLDNPIFAELADDSREPD